MSAEELAELKDQHRREHERRYADRIKALLLWDSGWTLEQISEALLLDESTIRRFRKLYEDQGLDRLLDDDWKGSERRLTQQQERKLSEHLQEQVYVSTKAVADYVKTRFGIEYSQRGMHHVLRRLGFVYKKTKLVPGKADAERQKAFLQVYEDLKEEKREEDPIYFLDGVHALHNPQSAYGWILKGKEQEIPTNTGRRRLNLNGALNAETHEVIIRDDPSINAQSTIALLKQVEQHHPEAKEIYVILDNARYYRNQLVREYVENSKIVLLFLPPYAPNLNLIERLWKFFKKKVLANRYYESFIEFRRTSLAFFRKLPKFQQELDTLLTDNFQIIGASA